MKKLKEWWNSLHVATQAELVTAATAIAIILVVVIVRAFL